MTVLNKSLWRGSHCSAMSKWPVEDTGRNSVTPSIIPSRTAVNKSCTGRLDDKTATMTRGKWWSVEMVRNTARRRSVAQSERLHQARWQRLSPEGPLSSLDSVRDLL